MGTIVTTSLHSLSLRWIRLGTQGPEKPTLRVWSFLESCRRSNLLILQQPLVELDRTEDILGILLLTRDIPLLRPTTEEVDYCRPDKPVPVLRTSPTSLERQPDLEPLDIGAILEQFGKRKLFGIGFLFHFPFFCFL